MEIITIESSAFKELAGHIKEIAAHIRKTGRREENERADTDELLTSKEVAGLLRVSRRTLQRMRDDRIISYTYAGNSCRYRRSDIERYMKERQSKAERNNSQESRIGKEATDGDS